MVAAFFGVLFLAPSTLILTGFVICAEYRWVARLEYLARVDTRNWDAYWPIEIPANLDVPLY